MTTPQWRRHLTTDEEGQQFDRLFEPDEQNQLRQLLEKPGQLADALRKGQDVHVTLARADVLPRLLTWFTPRPDYGRDGWEHHQESSGLVGSAWAVVEWTFAGTYEPTRVDAHNREVANTSFNGLRALGQKVTLDGVTLVSVESALPQFRRYIDWAGLFAQLGLSLNWRIPQEVHRDRSTNSAPKAP